MKTIHDEKIIKDIMKNYQVVRSFEIECAMQEYAEYIREKTIDECIACVPNKVVLLGDDKVDVSALGYNTCREQTITNLNNLKNNV